MLEQSSKYLPLNEHPASGKSFQLPEAYNSYHEALCCNKKNYEDLKFNYFKYRMPDLRSSSVQKQMLVLKKNKSVLKSCFSISLHHDQKNKCCVFNKCLDNAFACSPVSYSSKHNNRVTALSATGCHSEKPKIGTDVEEKSSYDYALSSSKIPEMKENVNYNTLDNLDRTVFVSIEQMRHGFARDRLSSVSKSKRNNSRTMPLSEISSPEFEKRTLVCEINAESSKLVSPVDSVQSSTESETSTESLKSQINFNGAVSLKSSVKPTEKLSTSCLKTGSKTPVQICDQSLQGTSNKKECFTENCTAQHKATDPKETEAKDCSTLIEIERSLMKKINEERFLKSSFFIHSNFVNVPPTIRFVTEPRNDSTRFKSLTKPLKWKIVPLTPIVVRNIIFNSGFEHTSRSHCWLGTWGKTFKPTVYRTLQDYQKVCHFPGICQIGRKDSLWRNLSRMAATYGKDEFDYFPITFVLPSGLKKFRSVYFELPCKKWIIKPPASARGEGITVINKWDNIPKNQSIIIQKYIANPYLINDSKFDLRIYVYVTSFDPLRIYMCNDGLVRFASARYSNHSRNLSNKYIHLTNFSINKHNKEYKLNNNNNSEDSSNHKWSLKFLWNFFEENNIESKAIWERIKDLVIKTVISCESNITTMIRAHIKNNYTCHELLGFDILLDENLKPWLLEVNISPSLHSGSELDKVIKGPLVKDVLNTAGFRMPEPMSGQNAVDEDYKPSFPYCIDKRLHNMIRTPDEKAKQSHFCQKFLDQKSHSSILEVLTPNDLRVLIETIDEQSRCGELEVVFPTENTGKCFRYFEAPKYYNLLLQKWFEEYSCKMAEGISFLNKFCEKNRHLVNPTHSKEHQWTENKFQKKKSPANEY